MSCSLDMLVQVSEIILFFLTTHPTRLEVAHGHVSVTAARSAVGKATRVSQIVPSATPFSAALWAALGAAMRAQSDGRREAPLGQLPCARFRVTAGWFTALLSQPQEHESLVPLERQVFALPIEVRLPDATAHIEFDASPWGGGALLKEDDTILEFVSITWDSEVAQILGATVGSSSWQSMWEFVMLLVALFVWGSPPGTTRCLFGDNVGALQDALTLKGTGSMLQVAREVAWRQVRMPWHFRCAHLPSERNVVADALSRVAAIPPLPLPLILLGTVQRKVPPWSEIFRAKHILL